MPYSPLPLPWRPMRLRCPCRTGRVSDPGDHADLVALIERYDPILAEVGEPAKGCGQIDQFERRLNTGTGWNNSGFWVVRQDGSAADFSYIWAAKGLPGDRSKDFYGACREAVALDLVLAKKHAFAEHGDAHRLVAYELTGVMVSVDDAHLDHAWSNFSHIVSGRKALSARQSSDSCDHLIPMRERGAAQACIRRTARHWVQMGVNLEAGHAQHSRSGNI